MTTPPMAGPTAREKLTLTRSSRDAARSCDRGTSSGTVDAQVGSRTAAPTPNRKVKAINRAGGICPSAVSSASTMPTTKRYAWIENSSQRRSNESASTPPGSARSMTGRVVAACTSETSAAAFGSSTSSHWAPTACIQVPVQLISIPIHNQRKALLAQGSKGSGLQCR